MLSFDEQCKWVDFLFDESFNFFLIFSKSFLWKSINASMKCKDKRVKRIYHTFLLFFFSNMIFFIVVAYVLTDSYLDYIIFLYLIQLILIDRHHWKINIYLCSQPFLLTHTLIKKSNKRNKCVIIGLEQYMRKNII